MSHAAGSRGGPFVRPRLERPEASLLKRFLGRIEIAEVAQQRRHRLGAGPRQRLVDPAEIGHVAPVPARGPAGLRLRARIEEHDRTDLVGAARIGRGELTREPEGLIERLAIDDVEAEQLLLGLGKRAIDDEWRVLVLAQRRGRRRRHQPRHRPELAGLGPLPWIGASFAMTASSSSLVQEQTTSSEW